MQANLNYAIKFVSDMNKAVAFHRDVLGLTLKFQSPEWSEFATGDVTLALHPASEKNPAGRAELGFAIKGLEQAYAEREKNGLKFLSPPKPLHGVMLATIAGPDGEECSVSEAGR
jgi:predicted enzyme related to lactoylglutathione lyase